MTDFEKWQSELDAAETAALSDGASSNTTQQLSAEDQAVHDLCAQFSEADLLAPAPAEATEEVKAHSLPASALSFKRSITSTDSVEEAYNQLLGIADELCEDLATRHWDESRNTVEAYIDQVKVAHDSGQIAGLASSVAKAMGKLKHVCEIYSDGAVKTPGRVADVGELFLLTALSAHELRRALSEAYDC